MTRTDAIVQVLTSNKALAHRYFGGLQPADYHHQPLPGVNSAAWILGHLTLTERRVTGLLGGELPDLPAGFDEAFAVTGKPAGDQHELPDGAGLLDHFYATRDRLISAVRGTPDAKLDEPTPKPSPVYTTIGDLAAFMAQHAAMHLGQVTVIRRSLGYPPVS